MHVKLTDFIEIIALIVGLVGGLIVGLRSQKKKIAINGSRTITLQSELSELRREVDQRFWDMQKDYEVLRHRLEEIHRKCK